MEDTVEYKYNKYYKSIGFERRGLFEFLEKEFKPKCVLYPGSSIHITPSFYLKHVTYVDMSSLSKEFFEDKKEVSQFIFKNKIYKESSFWEFIGRDFQTEIGLRDNYFDLLISIFSGNLIEHCENYVKNGGIILTTSLFSDNEAMKHRSGYQLTGAINEFNGKYKFGAKSPKRKKSKLIRKNNSFEYADNEEYYIYKKMD